MSNDFLYAFLDLLGLDIEDFKESRIIIIKIRVRYLQIRITMKS